jgi:hypothetical protein
MALAIYKFQVNAHLGAFEVVLDQQEINDIFESKNTVYITCECQKTLAHSCIAHDFTVKGATKSGAIIHGYTWFWPRYSIDITHPKEDSEIKMDDMIKLQWSVHISRNTIDFFTSNFSRTKMGSNIPESELGHHFEIPYFRQFHAEEGPYYKGEVDSFGITTTHKMTTSL